ncbi:MAG: hypothetical protein OEY37_04950 [Gammaproteobacteria bacterium]|nr:hypothetical protein [Gammaproteobacteria bacterium]MDH5618132.1 hypothetical protein [Gammaproteobacteria bacterium]
MMNRLTRTLCTLGVILMTLAACGEPPSEPEEELRAWVAAGVEAAESKERRSLVDMISTSYADARGNKRGDIENLLRVYFLRQNKIALLPNVEEITVYGDTAAKLVMTVGMAGTNDGVLGFSADAYRFELELEKDGDDWQLLAARWGELGDEIK